MPHVLVRFRFILDYILVDERLRIMEQNNAESKKLIKRLEAATMSAHVSVA